MFKTERTDNAVFIAVVFLFRLYSDTELSSESDIVLITIKLHYFSVLFELQLYSSYLLNKSEEVLQTDKIRNYYDI